MSNEHQGDDERLAIVAGRRNEPSLLLALADNANDEGACWPSIRYVARSVESAPGPLNAGSAVWRPLARWSSSGVVDGRVRLAARSRIGTGPSSTCLTTGRVANRLGLATMPRTGWLVSQGVGWRKCHQNHQLNHQRTITLLRRYSLTPRRDLAPLQDPTPLGPLAALEEAVAEACGYDLTATTTSGRGALGKAVKDLNEVGAVPDAAYRRARAYREKFPTADITALALAKWWDKLNGNGGRPYDEWGHPEPTGEAKTADEWLVITTAGVTVDPAEAREIIRTEFSGDRDAAFASWEREVDRLAWSRA